jgi:hypothetical protein
MEIGGRVEFDDLKKEVVGFRDAYNLRDDDAFVIWFLRAYVVDDDARARAALTDDNAERAIDAIHIDDSARVVHMVQGKFHTAINKASDKAADVGEFVDWAKLLYGPPPAFQTAIRTTAPIVTKKLKEARDRLVDRTGYRLLMYWVSTGRASATTITSAEGKVRTQGVTQGRRARFEFIGGTRVLELLHDYLYGVAPVVPLLELPVASDIVRTKDAKTGLIMRVFQMKGDDLAHLVDVADVRLFALNIRSYLRDTAVNKNMKRTLKSQPQNFLYFNNGVTFICDNAAHEDPDASDVLTLTNPQIINGQQTTRVLHESDPRESAKATVLVRVIAIPRGAQSAHRHEALISNIVQATNWQNSIKLSDLRSNDIQQVIIERGLRRTGIYHYARKKQPRRDTKAEAGKGVRIITRDEMARAVGGCRIESSPLRGVEALFSDHYEEVFGDYKISYYLTCYWLWRRTKDLTGRQTDSVARKRSTWLALFHTYSELFPTIKKRYDIFLDANERPNDYPDVMDALVDVIDSSVSSSARFYRTVRGTNDLPSDETNFFKTKAPKLSNMFAEFWPTDKNASLRKQHEKAYARFVKAFEAAELR